MKNGVRLAFALALVLCSTGCDSPNKPPVVTSLDGPAVVSARDSAAYSCQAYDPEWRSLLRYHWSASSGSIARESASTAMWLTPAASETAWVYVAVEDDSGSSTTDSMRVRVLRDTMTFIPGWEGAVKPGMYVTWYDSIIAGDTVFGRTNTPADSFGDVFLMALDEANFTRWVEHGTPVVIYRRIAYGRYDTFSFAVGVTDQYHIVIDNTQGDADYNYWIRAISVGP
jgi:hypothetical protein